jgi:hypothetical protein
LTLLPIWSCPKFVTKTEEIPIVVNVRSSVVGFASTAKLNVVLAEMLLFARSLHRNFAQIFERFFFFFSDTCFRSCLNIDLFLKRTTPAAAVPAPAPEPETTTFVFDFNAVFASKSKHFFRGC